MSAVVKNKLLLYADDSGILVSGKNKQDREQILTKYLNWLRPWLIDNKRSWKNKLQTTQNKLIRFVLDLKSRAHISKEHFELVNCEF